MPVINFGRGTVTFHYKLGTLYFEWAEHTKYFGAIIQSNLRFDQCINNKCLKFQKLLGEMKHLMRDVLDRLSYWFTQVNVDLYSNMQMWCGTLRLKIDFMI